MKWASNMKLSKWPSAPQQCSACATVVDKKGSFHWSVYAQDQTCCLWGVTAVFILTLAIVSYFLTSLGYWRKKLKRD